MPQNDERPVPGGPAGTSAGGVEAATGRRFGPGRYKLANIAIIFSTSAGTLYELDRDLEELTSSSLVERAVALDRVLKQMVEAIGETRTYLHDCVVEAVARGASQP